MRGNQIQKFKNDTRRLSSPSSVLQEREGPWQSPSLSRSTQSHTPSTTVSSCRRRRLAQRTQEASSRLYGLRGCCYISWSRRCRRVVTFKWTETMGEPCRIDWHFSHVVGGVFRSVLSVCLLSTRCFSRACARSALRIVCGVWQLVVDPLSSVITMLCSHPYCVTPGLSRKSPNTHRYT